MEKKICKGKFGKKAIWRILDIYNFYKYENKWDKFNVLNFDVYKLLMIYINIKINEFSNRWKYGY